MKIKIDFVTNSSSTSFVVMGSTIEMDKVPQNIMEKVQELEEEKQHNLEVFTEGSDLWTSVGYEYDGEIMVGIPYDRMKDDETLREFKARIKKQIMDSFGIEVDPHHIEECWMDG